eukprot:188447_1
MHSFPSSKSHKLPETERGSTLYNACNCLCQFSSNLILNPFGRFKVNWDKIVMVLLLYSSFEIPYRLAFDVYLSINSAVGMIALLVDILLCINIFINAHTAYVDPYDPLRIITNSKYIKQNYLRGWLCIDLVISLPIEFAVPESADSILNTLRLLKLIRFIKLVMMFDFIKKNVFSSKIKLRLQLIQMLFLTLLLCHSVACIWCYVGMQTTNSVMSTKAYRYGWYFAVDALFSINLGNTVKSTVYLEMIATNTIELWISSICTMLGCCCFAYFIAIFILVVTEQTKIDSYESEQLKMANKFCEMKQFPSELTRAILTHTKYYCSNNHAIDGEMVMPLLPSYLQHDVLTHISKQFL